jgi:hypothetical protein
MKELIERFYNTIRLGDPLPIPYREILLTARIMDEIFRQIYPAQERVAAADRLLSDPPTEQKTPLQPSDSDVLSGTST